LCHGGIPFGFQQKRATLPLGKQQEKIAAGNECALAPVEWRHLERRRSRETSAFSGCRSSEMIIQDPANK
jgi:hypothetical protein